MTTNVRAKLTIIRVAVMSLALLAAVLVPLTVQQKAAEATTPPNPTLYSDTFSASGDTAGWSFDSPSWSVGSGTLNTTTSSTGIVGDQWTDYQVSADLKFRNATDRAGVIFRVVDPNNFYLAHIAAGDPNVYLFKVVNGVSTLITAASNGTNFLQNVSYTLKIKAAGSAIQVFVGSSSTALISTSDSTFTYGRVGVQAWTVTGAPDVSFDNMNVTDLLNYLYHSDFNDNDSSDWDFNPGTDANYQTWGASDGWFYGSSFDTGTALATVGSTAWTDYEAKTDLTLEGEANQNAGLIVRYQSPTSYYLASVNNQYNIVGLQKRTSSGVTTLAGAVSLPSWFTRSTGIYTLRVKVTGATIKVFVENEKDKSTTPLITYTDNSNPYLSGKAGLQEWSGTADFGMHYAAFDNFNVVTTENHKISEAPAYKFNSDFTMNTAGWSTSGPTWTLQNQEFSSSNPTPATTNTAYAGSTSWTDYTLSADFMLKNTGDFAAFKVRSDGVNNSYRIRFAESSPTATTNNLTIDKEVAGVNTNLLNTTTNRVVKNVWYNVKIRVTGNLIEVFLQGYNNPSNYNYVSLRDSTFSSGKIGLDTLNMTGAVDVRYDNVAVSDIVTPTYPTTTPKVVTTSYITNEKVIASFDVTDYGAVAGNTDSTSAFQAALNAAAAAGGAVVWVPSGQYRINGSLEIPSGVVMRGDFKSPDVQAGVGTILKLYGNKDNADGKPAITVRGSAGLQGFTLWYPEQDASAVHAYPWTIWAPGSPIHGAGANATIKDVNLVNSYRGIRISGAIQMSILVQNVWGSPLVQGMFIDNIFDVSRIYNVSFKPTYWVNSGFAGAPADATLRAYTKANGMGIRQGHSDFQGYDNITIDGYGVGMWFGRSAEYGGSATLSHLTTTDVNTAVKVGMFSDLSIDNSSLGVNTVGVTTLSDFDESLANDSILLNTVSITSAGRDVELLSNGKILMQNVTFANWGASTQAVYASNGSLTVEGSNFQQNRAHIKLESTTKGSAILGNTYTGGPQITNLTSSGTQIDTTTAYTFTAAPTADHSWATPRTPSSSALFNVKSATYGAVGNGVADDASAIQAALNAAHTAGGGTVYLPAGMYRVSTHLTVYGNTELRGVDDTPFHTQPGRGTILLASEGKGNASGTPFITLNASAGVRGLIVFYPDFQVSKYGDTATAYPWTIQGTGTGVYTEDVTLGDSYQGVDFATYNTSNHYIRYLGGYFYKAGIAVGNNSTAGSQGWIEDTLVNPHYMMDSAVAGKQTGSWDGPILGERKNLVMFKFGKTVKENVLGGFSYGAKYEYQFAADASGKFTGIFHQSDADGVGDTAIRIEDADSIKWVGGILCPPVFDSSDPGAHDDGAQIAIQTLSSFTGTAQFFNMVAFADGGGIKLGGGTTVLQTMDNWHNADQSVPANQTALGQLQVTGGNATVNNIFLRRTASQVTLSGGSTVAIIVGNGGTTSFGVTNGIGGSATIQNNFGRSTP